MGTEEGSKKLLWYCTHCSRASAKLLSRLQKLEIDPDKTRATQNKVVNEIKEVKEDTDKKNKEFNARQNALEGEMEAVVSIQSCIEDGYLHSRPPFDKIHKPP